MSQKVDLDPDLSAMVVRNKAILDLLLTYLLTDQMDRKDLDRTIVFLAEETDKVYVSCSDSELLRKFLKPLRDSFDDVASSVKQMRTRRFSD